jgi:hypothetical protein
MFQANGFAYLALALFLPIALLALALSRTPTPTAFALILAGAMFLPQRAAWDLLFLPSLGKEQIIYLGVLIGLALFHPRSLSRARPGTGLELLALPLIVGGSLTVLTNRDPLVYGPRLLPGMQPLEAVTRSIDDLLVFAIPFFLGRALIRTPRDLRTVLGMLAGAGLLYSLFVWIEVRLSPQFHYWVYGTHPHFFTGAVRSWGYRPWVFMENGLALAMFVATTLLAAAGLARARLPIATRFGRFPSLPSTFYLAAVLVFVKSVAAIVWGLCVAVVVGLFRIRWAAGAVLVLCLFVAGYPAIRAAKVLPLERIVELADAASGRGWSLAARFENEDLMLAKASQRLWFGWGGYARGWIFDPVTGEELTAPDGFWIILLTSRGIVGFATTFGLFLVPIFAAARALGRVRSPVDQSLLLGLAAIVLVRALDQLPNGLTSSYPIFLAGGLSSLAHALPAPARRGARRRRRRAPAPGWSPAEEPPEPAPSASGLPELGAQRGVQGIRQHAMPPGVGMPIPARHPERLQVAGVPEGRREVEHAEAGALGELHLLGDPLPLAADRLGPREEGRERADAARAGARGELGIDPADDLARVGSQAALGHDPRETRIDLVPAQQLRDPRER